MKKKLIFKRIIIFIVVIPLLTIMLLVSVFTYRAQIFKPAEYDYVAPVLPVFSSEKTILVISKTNSFRHHEAIPSANKTLNNIAEKYSWNIFFTENAAIHNQEQLNKFDLIIWNNVTGDILTDQQKIDFKEYMLSGGTWFGIHGSGGTIKHPWEWYIHEFLNADFKGHPMIKHIQIADVVFNKDSPISDKLPDVWQHSDEWYSFYDAPDKESTQIVAWLDEASYSVPSYLKMGAHPIVWKDKIGEGHMVYSAIGHTKESYTSPEYIQLIENVIVWLLEQ